MSSGTAAQPPDTAAPPSAGARPADREARRATTAAEPPPRGAKRSGRGWALLTAAAAALFCVALVLGAMRLYTDVDEADQVTDTPERTVDAFLEALLDQRDAAAAAEWLCADKADRDLGEAVARMSFIDGPGTFRWGEVTETGRSVGAATVSAELRVDDGGASSPPATWVFSLVAEEGEPQWLICGIAAA